MSVPSFESLSSDRIAIRAIRPDDVDALWQRRNDASTAEFQNWTLPYPREKAQELVDEMVGFDGAPPPDGWFQMSIDDVATGRPIGDLALGLTFGGRCAEIGWSIDAADRGKGIATEAGALLATWLFESVGVSRLQAITHPDNLASVRVAEQLGMVFEGHTRNSYWVGDENSDDWIFAMTDSSWRAWVERTRERPRNVELVDVDASNLAAVEALATHRSQQRLVATMAGTFADTYVAMTDPESPVVPWFRAVVADGEVVGAVSVREPSDDRPDAYLWRLLVDRMHQRRGIGGHVIDLVVAHAASLGAPSVTVSWMPGPGSPEPLYLARGFEPTGEIDDGEIVARRLIS